MPTCDECGGHVSYDYERVFAHDGPLRCVDCRTGVGIDLMAGLPAPNHLP